ncbi:MAG: homoserine O-acetyltransferase MetA [Bacillota bacterium]
MPVVIPGDLPAYDILKKEKIFVMKDARAYGQDIRPLEVCIVNLMPKKIETETQLIRMLANTPLQINIHLVHMKSHESRNTRRDHLDNFYGTFEDIKNRKFDGMIITGAPVESLPYEEVDYWDELVQLMEYSKRNVYSTMHICWGAQAALYYHFGLKRSFMDDKLFGVFAHDVTPIGGRLMRGFDDKFYAPHSRHTQILREEYDRIPEMRILAESQEAGVHISSIADRRQIFIQGHGEYDRETLKKEYERDLAKGIEQLPKNYFSDDDPNGEIVIKWRGHSQLLFSNWLNYCVYQETPYIIDEMEPIVY